MREPGRAKGSPAWRPEKGSDGQEVQGREFQALQRYAVSPRTDPCLAEALGGSLPGPSPLGKWASRNRLCQNCSPERKLTPPSSPDQTVIPPCPGREWARPTVPERPGQRPRPHFQTRREAVCVAFGLSYKGQDRTPLEQVIDCEDIQYFRDSLTKGILKLYMTVGLAFILILRQLLGKEEEETLELTYISISGAKPPFDCCWLELSPRRGWKNRYQMIPVFMTNEKNCNYV